MVRKLLFVKDMEARAAVIEAQQTGLSVKVARADTIIGNDFQFMRYRIPTHFPINCADTFLLLSHAFILELPFTVPDQNDRYRRHFNELVMSTRNGEYVGQHHHGYAGAFRDEGGEKRDFFLWLPLGTGPTTDLTVYLKNVGTPKSLGAIMDRVAARPINRFWFTAPDRRPFDPIPMVLYVGFPY